jgi:hypothetical protein
MIQFLSKFLLKNKSSKISKIKHLSLDYSSQIGYITYSKHPDEETGYYQSPRGQPFCAHQQLTM